MRAFSKNFKKIKRSHVVDTYRKYVKRSRTQILKRQALELEKRQKEVQKLKNKAWGIAAAQNRQKVSEDED